MPRCCSAAEGLADSACSRAPSALSHRVAVVSMSLFIALALLEGSQAAAATQPHILMVRSPRFRHSRDSRVSSALS